MLISKRIKWLPWQCLFLLSLSEIVLGDTAVLPTCGNGVATASSDYCTSMETSGYCLTADKKLYKLTAKVTGEAAANGKCEADVTAGDRQFSTAGDSITIQGEITGLIYNCKADQTKPNTDPVTCTPITTGYYMSSTNLYHCSNSICSAVTLSEEGYYIDASSKDATGNYASLIKCTLNSSNKCEFENASSAMPSTANEVYYFKNGQNSKKLIQCTFSTSV
jgi:hypothetical protein